MDWSPLWLSLKVASCATVLSVVVGMAIAYPLARSRFAGQRLAVSLVNLPLVLPPTVLGYALLVALGRRSPVGQLYEHIAGHPLVFTWQGAVVASCVASLPLFVGNARIALAAVNPDIIAAARTEGAGFLSLFLHILIPLARPGLVAGTTLAFARALGDFGATIMVAGDTPGYTQTMPLAVYDAVMTGRDDIVRIYVLIAVLLSVAACLIAGRFEREG